MNTARGRWLVGSARVPAAVALLIWASATPAAALELTTPYPVVVEPGQDVTLDLHPVPRAGTGPCPASCPSARACWSSGHSSPRYWPAALWCSPSPTSDSFARRSAPDRPRPRWLMAIAGGGGRLPLRHVRRLTAAQLLLLERPSTCLRPPSARTSIRLGMAASVLGKVMWRRPSSNDASILSACAWLGRVTERRKAP